MAVPDRLRRAVLSGAPHDLVRPRTGWPMARVPAAELFDRLCAAGAGELAMGAITSSGDPVLDRRLVERLGISSAVIGEVAARERAELERRERVYREGRPHPDTGGRTVILVDDGLATGSTVVPLRASAPAAIVVAVPVAPPSACRRLRPLVDDLVCMLRPHELLAVGEWYERFEATSDAEVRSLLHASARHGEWPETA